MNTTIDEKEIEFFSNLSKHWWDFDGPLGSLHKLADVRIEFLLRNIARIKKNKKMLPLQYLNCIDVGCGGGILSERLKRLGGNITGIDTSNQAIDVAKEHAKKSNLKINYKCISTSKFLKTHKDLKFDVVIASEVIEHVNNRSKFLHDLSNLLKDRGLIIITTLNKSLPSIVLAKYFAENILKIIPKGTHDIEKFVTPEKLIHEAKKYNIILDDLVGFSPIFSLKSIFSRKIKRFELVSNPIINYGIAGLKISQ